jgi:carbonic anhydrase
LKIDGSTRKAAGVTSFIHMQKGDFFFHISGWTTDPPTEEGWYWAVPQSGVFRKAYPALIVYVHEDPNAGCLMVMADTPLIDFTHWIGPLPPPDPPQ